MKQKLIFALVLVAFTTKGVCQTSSEVATNELNKSKDLIEKAKNDTLPTVEFTTTASGSLQPAFYINGKHYNLSITKTIDPQDIDSISVLKKEIVINNTKYNGQIYIKLKKEYNPKLISLTAIQQKYTKPTSMPTIFLIDNDIIKDNYADYLIDEKKVLKIIVDTTDSHIAVIKLITRTEENIKKANEITIKGAKEIQAQLN
ncbi:MAG: hypothetical protein H6Q14_486 [Bacteroidetes bacterium]|jgi:hypothetical protein|nr:hypothetical protein [Bacteroidota bacterium]